MRLPASVPKYHEKAKETNISHPNPTLPLITVEHIESTKM